MSAQRQDWSLQRQLPGTYLRASVLCVQCASLDFHLCNPAISRGHWLHKNITPNLGTSCDVTLSVCRTFGSYSWHESVQSYLPSKHYCRKASTHSNTLLGLSSPPPPVSKGRLQKRFKDRVETLGPFKNNWNFRCPTSIALLTSHELLQARVSSTTQDEIQLKEGLSCKIFLRKVHLT